MPYVLVESGHELGVALEVLDRREGAPRYGGGERVGKELRARALSEIVGERGGAGGKAPRSAPPRPAQRWRDDIPLAPDAAVLPCAPARRAEHTRGLPVVHGEDRAVLPCP